MGYWQDEVAKWRDDEFTGEHMSEERALYMVVYCAITDYVMENEGEIDELPDEDAVDRHVSKWLVDKGLRPAVELEETG